MPRDPPVTTAQPRPLFGPSAFTRGIVWTRAPQPRRLPARTVRVITTLTPEMGAGMYAAGAALFLIVAGCSVVTTVALLRPLTHLSGPPRWLAAAIVFTAALTAAHMVPGVLGVLTRGTVLAAAVLMASAAWLLIGRRAGPPAEADVPPAPDGPRLTLVIAGAAGAAILACLFGYYRTEATRSVISDDMFNFHLPLVVRWIQSGSFWPVVDLLPYDTTGNYPQNGDVLMLASVLPWRGDAFARFAVVPFVGLSGLATYALGRELRADRARAALMATVVVSIPILLAAGVTSALPDAVMYGTFGAGLVFAFRLVRTRRLSDALLAGLGLGLAFGTKWYAVPAVVAVLVLLTAALLVERVEARRAARLIGPAAGAVALTGGFWLVRNAVESGSPFFPAGWVPIGGRSDLGNPGPRTDFPLAHYLFDGRVWRDVVLPDELRAFGAAGILLVAGILIAAALAVAAARRGGQGARPAIWALLTVAVLVALYVITPNTASGLDGHPVLVFYSARYLVPAAIPAAAAIAWAAGRARTLGVCIDVLAAIAVADGLRRAFHLSPGRIAVGVVAVACLAAGAWALTRLPSDRRGRAMAVGVGAAVALAVLGGYAVERRYGNNRLRGQDVTIDRFLAQARDGDRVGIGEQWSVIPPSPVLAMFGDRLRNRVSYLGEHVDGVNKPYRDPARLRSRLARDRYEWLMIGRGLEPQGTTPAMRWVRADGYDLVAQSARLALYRRRQHP
jgi:hypothetical protein